MDLVQGNEYTALRMAAEGGVEGAEFLLWSLQNRLSVTAHYSFNQPSCPKSLTPSVMRWRYS